MTNLTFYDAAYPPSPAPTGFDGVAFYIGGDTPHVWTLAEIESQPARFRLPIFVRSDPQQANASVDVAAALSQLHAIGAPTGVLVALDSETSVDPNYVAQVYYGLRNGGYTLMDYGSISSVFGNHNPDGYYWGAHWTNVNHLEPGTQMTQWESLNSYDESTALPTLPFWDTHMDASPQPTAVNALPTFKSCTPYKVLRFGWDNSATATPGVTGYHIQVIGSDGKTYLDESTTGNNAEADMLPGHLTYKWRLATHQDPTHLASQWSEYMEAG